MYTLNIKFIQHRTVLFGAAFFAFIAASCSSQNEIIAVGESEISATDEPQIVLSEPQFQSSKMHLGSLSEHTFHEVINANGQLDVPPQNRVSVSPYFAGYVKEILIISGENVKKGQKLFVIENPDFIKIQQEFLEAKGQLAYLQSDYERQKNLAADNVASQKNYLKAEADFTVTQVRYESLKKQLQLMNINPSAVSVSNITTSISIAAPISGYIDQVNITKGSFVNASQMALNIIDTKHMHVELSIFEKDLAKIAIGQPIQFRLQNNERVYEAEVHLINKTINHETRMVQVHAHIIDESANEHLSPGMYVEAQVFTKSVKSLSLPQEATVEIDGRFYVLARTKALAGAYVFEQREVKVGKIDQDYIQILNAKDFDLNTEFLVQGAFILLGE